MFFWFHFSSFSMLLNVILKLVLPFVALNCMYYYFFVNICNSDLMLKYVRIGRTNYILLKCIFVIFRCSFDQLFVFKIMQFSNSFMYMFIFIFFICCYKRKCRNYWHVCFITYPLYYGDFWELFDIHHFRSLLLKKPDIE